MEKSVKQANQEIPYLHFLRIFATLSVILLHCIMPAYNSIAHFETRTFWVCSVINSVTRTGVPLFFMMSGYLLLSNPKTLQITAFYKKRLPHLLVPLLAWNIIYYIYYSGENASFSGFFSELLETGSAYHLWFVYSMIAFYLLLPFLKRITDHCTDREIFLLFLLLIFATSIRPFLNTVLSVYIYLFDAPVNGYIPFFLLGYLLGKRALSKKIRILIYCGGSIGLLLCVFMNWYHSSHASLNFIANGGFQINHILCAAAVFVLFRQIAWDKLPRLTTLAGAWARRSFGIYFIHALALDLCVDYLVIDASPLAVALLRFAVTTLSSALVIYLIEKLKPLNRLLM